MDSKQHRGLFRVVALVAMVVIAADGRGPKGLRQGPSKSYAKDERNLQELPYRYFQNHDRSSTGYAIQTLGARPVVDDDYPQVDVDYDGGSDGHTEDAECKETKAPSKKGKLMKVGGAEDGDDLDDPEEVRQ
jgi:hypothetical protein